MRWLDGITDLMDMGFSKVRALVKDRKVKESFPRQVNKKSRVP